MPDLPPEKRSYSPAPRVRRGAKTGGPWAELRCRTNFSFLEGASHPDELVARAAELGYAALAVTDRNSVAGVVRAHVAAKACGLKLVIGAEITPEDAPPIILWAMHRAGYARLCRLITRGRRNATKGESRLTFADIAEHAEGLLAGMVLHPGCSAFPSPPGFARGEGRGEGGERFTASRERTPIWAIERSARPLTPSPSPPKRGRGGAEVRHAIGDLSKRSPPHPRPLSPAKPGAMGEELAALREVFGDRAYAIAGLHRGPDDRRTLERWMARSRDTGVSLVAANDVHYHVPGRQPLQDVLTAIRHGCTVEQLGDRRFPNAERHLKSPAEMATLFAACPEAVARTLEIAGRCDFSLDELRYDYPEELCPAGLTPMAHLVRLTWDGAARRYPGGLPDKVRQLVEHELALIEELNYAAYFLTVWDLVRFARERGILCQGRGSAANSAVCYCLGVTSVDPERIDVLFERFISKERNEAPDIDVDFEHERREEVIQYLYEKYGRERAGMTAEVITYRPRSAVRDVGKALGLSLDQVDALAKHIDHLHDRELLAARFREAGLPPRSKLGRQLIALVMEILGFPRHLSQHVGGMVLTNGPLCEVVPIENATMPGRTVIEWDKDDLDALGILKVDVLALGMLTAIRKCFALVEKHHGRALTLATVPADDPAVYDMIGRADTMGVFQIESRAQMAMLPRLKPRCFYDLVIEVAIVRPGPIQGDMVHPYLKRRRGDEPVEYPDERIKEVLHKTLGVPIFQEQAMRLAIVAAGFTPGEADQLRRAMGAWRKQGVIDQFQKKLVDGMTANGYSADFAERVFKQIRGFGEYGFPESHSASFALLVWVSCWLKHYYPAAFCAALLNSQPMGFYAPAQLVADAKRHGVDVLPPDANFSDWDCTLEFAPKGRRAEDNGVAFSLRLGLRLIRGLSEADVRCMMAARGDRPFASMDDFIQRTHFSSAVLLRLARGDAFRSLELNRRESLWESLPDPDKGPLLQSARMPAEDIGTSPRSHGDTEKTKKTVKADDRQDFSVSPCLRGEASANDRDPTPASSEPERVALPPMSPLEDVVSDYRTLGLTLRAHPMTFLRDRLTELKAVPASALKTLPKDKPVTVGGIVLMRQRPGTAKGVTFVTLEDETGMANLIIHLKVWEQFHRIARTATVLVASGPLQREGDVIHVLVRRLRDLSHELSALHSASRDFH